MPREARTYAHARGCGKRVSQQGQFPGGAPDPSAVSGQWLETPKTCGGTQGCRGSFSTQRHRAKVRGTQRECTNPLRISSLLLCASALGNATSDARVAIITSLACPRPVAAESTRFGCSTRKVPSAPRENGSRSGAGADMIFSDAARAEEKRSHACHAAEPHRAARRPG